MRMSLQLLAPCKHHTDQMFWTTAEAKGEVWLHNYNITSIGAREIYYLQFQVGTSVVVPQCYFSLCPCVYSLQQYGHLYNSFQFSFLLQLCFLAL